MRFISFKTKLQKHLFSLQQARGQITFVQAIMVYLGGTGVPWYLLLIIKNAINPMFTWNKIKRKNNFKEKAAFFT